MNIPMISPLRYNTRRRWRPDEALFMRQSAIVARDLRRIGKGGPVVNLRRSWKRNRRVATGCRYITSAWR